MRFSFKKAFAALAAFVVLFFALNVVGSLANLPFGWKTFVSDEYSLSVSYPPEWKVSNYIGDARGITISNPATNVIDGLNSYQDAVWIEYADIQGDLKPASYVGNDTEIRMHSGSHYYLITYFGRLTDDKRRIIDSISLR